jgi:hypothetical protein
MKPIYFLLVCALAGLAACASATSNTANPDQAAFVTLLGEDTLAVEVFQHTREGMEATVVLRTPRTTVQHYRLDLDEQGGFERMEAEIREPGSPPDAAPINREVYVLEGDSLEVTVTEDGESETRTIAGHGEMLPFLDMIHWPFDLMLTRAHASEQDSVTQDLFTGRGSMPFVVRRTGDGSMSATHPSRGTMEVEVDDEGRLLRLDAGATTRKLIVTRVPATDVDTEAIAGRFAAQDAAGNSFGALSGRGEATVQVNGATITLDYGQPAKRGREIFGALVPWGEVWRTGANQATHFTTDRALKMGSLEVPPGEYTLFTIPEAEGGTLIINKQTGQGGTTYNQDRDLGRVPMTMRKLPDPVELFTIDVEETGDGGELQLKWDQTAFVVPFSVAD